MTIRVVLIPKSVAFEDARQIHPDAVIVQDPGDVYVPKGIAGYLNHEPLVDGGNFRIVEWCDFNPCDSSGPAGVTEVRALWSKPSEAKEKT